MKWKKLVILLLCTVISITTGVFTSSYTPLRASAYNADAAVDYALAHAKTGTYNPDYHNYNPDGGDCANFVSQCLYAGGLPMTSGWHYWGYPDVTGSWVGCPQMRSYFEGAGYKVIDNPSTAQLFPGNPILYWNNNTWSHAAIYVGDGKVCAHNNDRYKVNWTLGYSKTCTILINSGNTPVIIDDELDIPYPRPSGSPLIQKGSTGNGVCWVQSALNKVGYSLTVDGDFGTNTDAAVRSFQSKYGLEVDGQVGPATINKLVEVIKAGTSEEVPTGPDMMTGAGQTVPDGDYYIFSLLDPNFYLDIEGAAKPGEKGTNVSMCMASNGKLPPECDVWTLQYLDNGFYKIKQKGTNICLDVQGGSHKRGTNVQVWTEHNDAPEQWSIMRTDTGYQIQAKNGSYCLDVQDGGTASGTNVRVWDANGSPAQRFCFVPYGPSVGQTVADGVYTIRSASDPSYCMDVPGDDNAAYLPETNVQLWTVKGCNDNFEVKYLGDGYYSICESVTGLALDIVDKGARGYMNVKNNIQLYTNNQTRNQKWILRDAGDGYYYIISAYSGYCADLSSGIAEKGRNIAQYTYNGSNAQKWKFTAPLEAPQISIVNADKAVILAEETVSFIAVSNNATGYTINITKDGEQIITQDMPGGKLALSFDELGLYSVYVTAYNDAGTCDSQAITVEVAEEKPAPTPGDLNSDGEVSTIDLVLLQKHMVREQVLTAGQSSLADLNADGRVNVIDLTLLKRMLLSQ
ncbi:MAG: RICIN domain-containing protein [Oscillospiraceae bacterium]|nr:RICIN domain-containing protein [Oscillospiraceae bacterium]